MFKKLPVGKFLTNCYIIADDETKEAAVIDPANEFDEIKKYIEENKLKLKYILLTHAHGDHILALKQLKEYSGASIGVHQSDEEMLKKSELNLSGHFTSNVVEMKPDFYLQDGEMLKLGDHPVQIIHTPGHTMGGVSILFGKDLMSGDTLFARGIGRTDFYGGDYETLMNSIKTKLFVLPEDIRVHPGHGTSTTIQAEKHCNPFF